ncbi:hypothetical protein D0Y65_038405, partial [Glycine soja]
LGLYFDLQYFEDMVLEGSWDEVRTFFQQDRNMSMSKNIFEICTPSQCCQFLKLPMHPEVKT